MKGRSLVWPLVLLLAVALLGQTARWRARSTAGRILHQVEALTMAAVNAGRAPSYLLVSNLEALRRAAELDPLEIGIPIARGSQHFLLRNARAAIDSYEDALALEPRPEIYFNLGRAHDLAGNAEEARRNYQLGLRLSPRLASEVPAQYQ
ncbi:MAG TPA: tetratricopeptide repeat protein [Thermoanaerobaculia bacterium]